MFNFIITRDNQAHIVAFKSANGLFLTVCSKRFYRSSLMNVLSANNTFDNLCKDCKGQLDQQHSFILKRKPSLIRSLRFDRYYDLVFMHKHNYMGPKAKYTDLIEKFWSKLIKYKKSIKK